MRQEEVLTFILDKLEEEQIPYMITGSIAGNLYGKVRATEDADVVVQTNELSIRRFAEVFTGDFFADPFSAVDALRHFSMFNVIHVPTAFKVDVIFPKPREYDARAFERRVQKTFFGKERWFASPEDVIVSKLEWSQLNESERQLLDVANIIRLQGQHVDHEYVRTWSDQLGVSDRLVKAISLARS
jgi:hypothetical protein